jgi:hypothetical protein
MSTVAISAAMEAKLLTLGWSNETAFENTDFDPSALPPGTPWQRVSFEFYRPIANETNGYYRQPGAMIVMLVYPLKGGAGAALARAEAIRSLFPRPTTVPAAGGINVNIDEIPQIDGALIDIDYRLPVIVPFWAPITA